MAEVGLVHSYASPYAWRRRQYLATERPSAKTSSRNRNCWPSYASCATRTGSFAKLRFGWQNTRIAPHLQLDSVPDYTALYRSCVGPTRSLSPARSTR